MLLFVTIERVENTKMKIFQTKNGKFGLADENSIVVIDPKYDEIKYLGDEIYRVKYTKNVFGSYGDKVTCYKLLNSSGKAITKKEYSSINKVESNDNSVVGSIYECKELIFGNKSDIITSKGKVLASNVDDIFTGIKKYIIVRSLHKVGYRYKLINYDGTVSNLGTFDGYYAFKDSEKILINKSSKWRLVDLSGKKEDIFFDECTVLNLYTSKVVLVRRNSKYGALDNFANQIFECEYYNIKAAGDTDYLLISKSENMGFALANLKGRILTDYKYEYATYCSYRLRNIGVVLLGAKSFLKCDLCNFRGEILYSSKASISIPSIYDDLNEKLKITEDNEMGLFIRIDMHNKKSVYGYLTHDGRLGLRFEYDLIEELTPNAVRIYKDGKVGIFSVYRGIIKEPIYDDIKLDAIDGDKYYIVLKKENKEERFVISIDDKEISAEVFDYAESKEELNDEEKYGIMGTFKEIYYIIMQKDTYKKGLMKKNGKMVLEPIYDDILDLSEDIFVLRCGTRYGYKTINEELVYDFVLSAATPFKEGYAFAEKDGKAGVIDKKGNVVVPFSGDLRRMYK